MRTNNQLISKNTSYFLRGIATLMIVLSHYFEWGENAGLNDGLIRFMTSLGDIGVAVFFFLSGYSLYKGYNDKKTDMQYLVKRLKNMYIPYLVIVGTISIFAKSYLEENWLIRYLTGTDYWFIVIILILYISFYFVGKLPKYRVFIMSVFIFDLSVWLYLKGFAIFWYDAIWCFALGLIISKYDGRMRLVRKGFVIDIREYVFGFLGKLSLYIYLWHVFVFYRVINIESLGEMHLYLKMLIAFLISVALSFLTEKLLKLLYLGGNMRKLIKTVILSLALVTLLGMGINSFAAGKKTTTIVSEDEQKLNQLNAYLNALIAMGASSSDIEFAKQAIANQQAVIAAKQATSLQTSDNTSSLTSSNASLADANQQALLQQYYAALAKMQKSGVNTTAQGLGVILVGDSRFVQMQGAAKGSGASFICENSKGYDWFVSEAIPRIDALTGKGTKIVINLGVNDPENIDKYISMVNAKAVQWAAKGAKVYYATVNPVSENPYTSQEQVDYFNSKLVTGLMGIGIIDTNTYLKTTGYTLVDGLHYTDATYNNIYAYILSKI